MLVVCLRVVVLMLLLISALVNMVRSAFIPFGFRICEVVAPWSKLHLVDVVNLSHRDGTGSKADESTTGSRVPRYILNLGSG